MDLVGGIVISHSALWNWWLIWLWLEIHLLASEEVSLNYALRQHSQCVIAGKLPIPYLYETSYCDPLGDDSVWGSLYNLSETDSQLIMLAAKV